MATFNIYIDKNHKNGKGKHTVYIRIVNNRTSSAINTGYHVSEQQIDKNGYIKDKLLLRLVLEKIEGYEEKVNRELGNNIARMTAKEITAFLKRKEAEESQRIDFIEFAREHIQKLKKAGREKRAKHIQTTINALVDFSGNTLDIGKITSKFLSKFEDHLRSSRVITRLNQFGEEVKTHRQPLTDTGVHDYMADIRTVFNEAINRYNDDEAGVMLITHYPFRKYKLSPANAPVKKNLQIEVIQKIIDLPDGGARQDLGRDVFLLSFFLVGMNTVDIYNIPYSAYKNGRITYRRSKTKKRRQDKAEISIKVEPEAEVLIKKYMDYTKSRLFSFHNRYCCSDGFNAAVNKGLQQVSQLIGSNMNGRWITAYYARHSWATIARNILGISIDDIALALNHVSENHKVTSIYIEKDFTRIDKANRAVMDLFSKA